MIDDLPELGDIFSPANEKVEGEEAAVSNEVVQKVAGDNLSILISKGKGNWIPVSFVDIAPSGIGLHVLLAVSVSFSTDELKDMKIRFMKKQKEESKLVKESGILVRWQERDPVSGKMKLGLHFHGDTKSDPQIAEILKGLAASK